MEIQYATGSRHPQNYVCCYVGPELRSQDQDNQQSMNVFDEDLLVESSLLDDAQSKFSDGSDITMRPEFRLRRGERYGWWHAHEQEESRKIALVHGAVNNFRTDILLDSGASVSMVSLGLARRLKLKLKYGKQISVSGLGGVPTNITASAEVKITLEPRVVYVVDVWVVNIGLDVLLGMNFMFSAGVRLCVKEGLVQLPDEETVLLSGRGLSHVKHGMAHGIRPKYTMYLQPGECRTIRLPAFRKLMRPSTIWAGRGDRWVTQVLYAWKVPAAIKVVNISDRIVTIDWRTEVAHVVENGFFPRAGRYTLIYENTISAKAQARESQRLDDLQKMEPPAVQTPNYPWPTKMLIRPSPGCGEARVINLQIVPSEVYDETSEVGERLSMRTPAVSMTVPEVSEISEVGDEITDVPTGETERVLDDETPMTMNSSTRLVSKMAFQNLEDIPKVEPEDDVFSDLPVSVMACTPVQQLELEYERVMRISAEELDLEPAVYVHEGSETLSQLREQLALLLDIKELSPKCDIDSADVGESGTSTPEDEQRTILKYHRAIFLGDGNAVPAPARGVTCDLDVGEANPVAQRPRSVAPHLSLKVYELLKKLLETRLIEPSKSPWASPIVIVLKKNGVDIQMCVDYRIVNGFITLSNYPLPLIDDLLVGFEDVL
ncbi:LOW QUALITY PROTEIN: hypothetical protein PHMEG_00012127 [Phytophthora megakarya]|uniref:Peptidase A2 domain-containing protein n=1 Tax=Phytophthora megakarya TaxID=4795 RepID=A0A225WA08_9STRA|nr:LOW QUALITY PROTEIN: hypothetical protein PHMEG_00012127 [Phytophthora megakarya]